MWVAPFGDPRILRLFTAPRGLSQLVASFIGSWCQGIHLTLFFAWTSSALSCCSLFYELSEFHLNFWLFTLREKAICLFWMFPPCNYLLRWNCSYYPNIGKTLNFDWSRYLMSSISVRFNSFLFFYSIFNEHKRTAIPFLLGISVQLYHRELTLDYPLYFPEWRVSALPTGRSGWTRTIDLALIRRAL